MPQSLPERGGLSLTLRCKRKRKGLLVMTFFNQLLGILEYMWGIGALSSAEFLSILLGLAGRCSTC